MVTPNKSLGQHWLKDLSVLAGIADSADLTKKDVVVEVGPGLGTLTSRLLSRAQSVIAVEFDPVLASKLPDQFPGSSLTVVSQDILNYDLSDLPKDYKVVANVPYYITSKIIQRFSESTNPPSMMVLLVQKEVAERLAALPGDMSILALAAQVYYEVSLDQVVKAELFTPPPKVDSQVVVMKRRSQVLVQPDNRQLFFQIVKAGFSAKRKKLRSSISGGLHMTKLEAEQLLEAAEISAELRAEDLNIDQWLKLHRAYGRLLKTVL